MRSEELLAMQIVDVPGLEAIKSDPAGSLVRRILVPLDGTPHSERALGSARALARAFNAEVVLVRANVSGARAGYPRVRLLGSAQGEAVHHVSLYLARKEHELRARGVRTHSRAPRGPTAATILETAAQSATDLVVMATHAKAERSCLSSGSVAREVLRSAEAPVLLLAATSRNPFDGAHGAGLSVLAPLDGTAASGAAALAYASLLGRQWAVQLILLRALGGPAAHGLRRDDPALYALATAPARHAAIAQLERLRSRALARGIAAWTGIVDGDLYEEAAHFARASADLVLISLHGHGVRRASIGEGALRVLRESGVPVLLVPPALVRGQQGAPDRQRDPGGASVDKES
jgi:nucleotide-binding universal stress UspA family protein